MIAPPEGGLGGTSIPGDPYFLQSLAAQLGSLAVELDEVRSGLLGLESVKWDGDAAEAFKGVMRQQPSRYTDAAESFTIAAGAISAYSAVLEDAQMLTARAGDLAAEAQIATQRWEASASNTGNDPGAEGRIVAEQIGLGGRADLAAASATLVATLREAETDAPRKPSLLHEVMADAWHYSVSEPDDVAIGFGKGAWGMVDGVYQIGKLGVEATNPLMGALDPSGREQADRELSEIGSEAWDHPVAFAKATGESLVDWDEWSKNPAEAVGELLPTVLLTLATGAGASASRVLGTTRAIDDAASVVGEESSQAAQSVNATRGEIDATLTKGRADSRVKVWRPHEGGGLDEPNISLDEALAAAKRNGLDLNNVDLRYESPDTPGYRPSGFGYSSFTFDGKPYLNDAGKFEITLQNLGLASERDAVATIAHEWAHLYLVGPTDHIGAEAFAQELMEGYIP